MASTSTAEQESAERFESLDARLNQIDDKFTRLEETILKLVKDREEATEPAERKKSRKRARESDTDEDGDGHDSYDESSAKNKGKRPLKKPTGAREELSDSFSDGEIHDDDEDTLSIDCMDDDLLKEINLDLDNQEKTADKVAESMADIINKRFAHGLSDNKLKERFDKYLRPENCPKMTVPRVNPEIWKDLPAVVKQADVKLASVQRAIVKATAALAQSTQVILKAHTQKKITDADVKAKVTDQNADALALLGHASHELSMRRRYSLRPHLPKDLMGLCSESVPITDQLFGDNLTAAVKEVRELDKLSRGTGHGRYQPSYDSRQRSKPWQKGHKERRPFLGQRQPYGAQKKHGGNRNGRQFFQRKA